MLVQEDWQRGFTRNSSRPLPQKETLSKWKRNLQPPLMPPRLSAHFSQLFNKGPDGLHACEPFRHGASHITSNFLRELYSQQNPGGHNNPWLSVHGNKVPFCKMWQRHYFLGLYTKPVFTLIYLCLSSVCSLVVLLASIFLGFPSSPYKYKEDRDNLWSTVSRRFPEMKPSGRDFGEDINGGTSK